MGSAIFEWGNCWALRIEIGGMPLAENSWIELLAWFPTQVRLEDGLHSCLDSLVMLTRWDWILYSVVDRAMNWLPCSGRAEGWDQDLKNQIRLQCVHWILWSHEATGFALQMGEAMGCALYSSAAVCRAIERATQHSVCSGWVPWLDRLKAVFSDEQGYALNSLPMGSGRSSSKAGKALCVLS